MSVVPDDDGLWYVVDQAKACHRCAVTEVTCSAGWDKGEAWKLPQRANAQVQKRLSTEDRRQDKRIEEECMLTWYTENGMVFLGE